MSSPSVADIVTTRADALDACRAVPSGAPGGHEDAMRAIRSTIGDNVTCLLITAGIVAASLAVVWYAACSLYAVLAEWRKHQLPRMAPGVSRQDDDDVPYAAVTSPDGVPLDMGPTPTAPIIAARMAKIAAKYGPYNDAMRQRAADKGIDADDIIDARILGRSDDDWRRAPDPRGARSAQVPASAMMRPFALRSPVYNRN